MVKSLEKDKDDAISAGKIKKILAIPENKAKALVAFGNKRKMGSIASTIGLPRNKAGRGALRAMLRKAGVYKENGGWVANPNKIDQGFAANLLEKIGIIEKHLMSSVITTTGHLGGGISETHMVHFADGSKGVFKPHTGESPGARKEISDGYQTEREVGAWEVAKLCGLEDLCTPCIVREHEGERGALLEFNQGDVAARKDRDERYDGTDNLARAAAFDFVIGNEDRHMGNWMITPNGGLKMIDHGLTFPDKAAYRRKNDGTLQGAALNQAKVPKETIDKMVANKEKIVESLKKLGLPEASVAGVERRIGILSRRASRDWNQKPVWNEAQIRQTPARFWQRLEDRL